MTPSKTATDFIKTEEGCVLHTYLDSASVPTIGYGTTLYGDGKKPKLGEVISQAYADAMLEREIKTKAMAVNDLLVNTKVNQNQFDALCSFTYNVGTTALRTSTLIKKVRNNPDDPTIREEFMKWNKITDPKTKEKVPLDTLTHRRKREADLYFTPIQ